MFLGLVCTCVRVVDLFSFNVKRNVNISDPYLGEAAHTHDISTVHGHRTGAQNWGINECVMNEKWVNSGLHCTRR